MATATATGRIAQVIGSTFDAEFEEGHLPEIYNALTVQAEGMGVAINLTGEVQQHLGGNRVRCVALGSTDGLVRGMEVVDTGGPVSVPVGRDKAEPAAAEAAPGGRRGERVPYEFLPDPLSILEEIVPVSFKVRLFKCFLDAAVSEQIARMVAMRGATENADDMIKSLTMQYNRARQSQITRELAEIIGGAAALE